MKFKFFELYKNWKCMICGLEDETFTHVWSCSGVNHHLQTIIDNSIFSLLYSIGVKSDKVVKEDVVSQMKIWNAIPSDTDFCFVDLIKGIIPWSLTDHLKRYNLKKEDIFEILDVLRDVVLYETYKLIWLPRCDQQKNMEMYCGITTQDKKKGKYSITNNHYSSPYKVENQDNLFNLDDVTKDYIYFGIDKIDNFTNIS